MADVLFDTTVFVDAYGGHPGARLLVEQVIRRDQRTFYSPVTVFELWLKPMSREEESRHRTLLATCMEAPFDSTAARIMADWLRSQLRSGRRRLLGDAMIAASAASLGATIYTRNPRDFTRFYTDVKSY
ncbi:MAG TPA: PIN domain-containing protein [Dehalococcoidia bacterium]|nr:PIN domain-containing protein [Dehalococcoidia bacterium]